MDPEDGLTLSPASLEADHCDQAVSPSQVSCDWLPEVTWPQRSLWLVPGHLPRAPGRPRHGGGGGQRLAGGHHGLLQAGVGHHGQEQAHRRGERWAHCTDYSFKRRSTRKFVITDGKGFLRDCEIFANLCLIFVWSFTGHCTDMTPSSNLWPWMTYTTHCPS